jgi:outer membrane protein assembly factor BamB
MIAYIVILSLLAISCFFANPSGLQAHGIASPPTHQHIAKEALKVWQDCPSEIINHAQKPIDTKLCDQCFAGYAPGKDIIIGSGEEDKEINPLPYWVKDPFSGELGGCSANEIGHELCGENEGRNGFMEHFWNPDVPNVGGYNCNSVSFTDNLYNQGLPADRVSSAVVQPPGNGHWDSAYRLAQDLWDNKVIKLYREGKWENNQVKIDQSYYWLGRVAHLLADITVPAHVHLLTHAPDIPILSTDWADYYESFFNQFTTEILQQTFSADLYVGKEYRFEELPNLSNFNWQEVHYRPSNLFRLFWYTAQKTQYYASSNTLGSSKANGNPTYKPIDGGPDRTFDPPLWYKEAPTIISNPEDIRDNLPQMAAALIPHAMKAVAGLYRLFWFEANAIKFGPAYGVVHSPAIGFDGTIYISDQKYLYALNPDGSQKWKSQVSESDCIPPVIGHDGTIYVTAMYGNIVRAFRPDGNDKWSTSLVGRWSTSPSIGPDATVYVGSEDNNLYAIRPSDGNIEWKFITGGTVHNIFIAYDGTIYITASDHNLYAINRNGTLKWKLSDLWGQQWGAIGPDGTLYVTYDNGLVAISRLGNIKWYYGSVSAVAYPPSVGQDGTIYFGTKGWPNKARLYAINPNGNKKWEFVIGNDSYAWDSISSCPAISEDGTIFISTIEYNLQYNNLYAINPQGKLKWMFQMPSSGASIASSTCIGGDGVLYAGLGDKLCSFNVAAKWPAKSSWHMYGANPQHTSQANLQTATLPFLHLLLGD